MLDFSTLHHPFLCFSESVECRNTAAPLGKTDGCFHTGGMTSLELRCTLDSLRKWNVCMYMLSRLAQEWGWLHKCTGCAWEFLVSFMLEWWSWWVWNRCPDVSVTPGQTLWGNSNQRDLGFVSLLILGVISSLGPARTTERGRGMFGEPACLRV